MRKILEDILELPYCSTARSGDISYPNCHESAVESVLCDHGLVKIPAKIRKKPMMSKKQRDIWLSGEGDHSHIPNNSYILQPLGFQNSPDFLVKKDNKLYFLECKSTKGFSPVYNSGLPKDGYTFAFSSKKYNISTLYRTECILSPEERLVLIECITLLAPIVNICNEKLKSLGSLWDFYMRAMYNHKLNYFEHEDREIWEQRVLDMCNE